MSASTVLHRILAATDLSAPARQAAQRAARLARETGASLTLCHALAQAPLQELRQWLGAPAADELLARSREELQALALELQGLRHGPVAARLDEGAVIETLMRAAEIERAELLVLAARGVGFLRRLVLGTTAERLLRCTAIPLLVVRQPPHEPYRRALLALDFSPWTPAVIAQARAVAPHARWLLFHAWQVPFEEKLRFAGVDAATIAHYREQARLRATQHLHAAAEQAGLKPGLWEPCLVEGDASLRLVEQEQLRACDLVVIGKHGQSAAEDLLLGSTTKHLLAEGLSDVLISTLPAR